MDNSHDYSALANSCIPNAIPTNVDPSLVDFREFYPYIPNEIKHRKRTTQAQLEVLERTFAHDKKPNGVMRMSLARELDMTPRGVQVWFQNRRAKEKTLAKKAAAKQQPQPQQADSPEPQEGPTANPSISLEPNPAATDSRHPSISPSVSPPTVEALESSQDSQSAIPPLFSARYELTDPNHPVNLRRGSLPIISRSASDDSTRLRIHQTFDPLARRGSLGIDVSRLAAHPYAHLAAAANHGGGGGLYSGTGPVRGHRNGSGKSNSLPGPKAADQYGHLQPSYRSIPSHRASMPYVFSQGTPQSTDTAFVPIKHSTPAYTSRYHDGLYSMSSRSITEPIPGPLPNPNFSFGDSTASPPAPSPSTSESSEQLAAALSTYAFPSATDADQEEELPPNASYGAFATRFSSIASLADSESSAFYSEPGSVDEYPSDFHPHSRRQSHVLDHFSNLGIEGHIPAPPTDSAKRSPEQVHTSENSGVNTAYVLSRPNMSNGGSPHPSTKPVRYLTSELASALSPNSDGSVPYDGTERYNEGARMVTNTVISPPTLESAPLVGNIGRACYENQYSPGSYSIYNDTFDAPSKVGHYMVPPYANGQSHSGLTNPTSVVSPVYSNQESTVVDVAAYRFGTSH